MSRHLLILGATAWLAAGAASAEVRIVRDDRGEPRLDVRPVARGIWTPSGVIDASVINPSGDILGDGYPASAAKDGRLLAAWVRPASDAVVMLRSDSSGASSQTLVADASADGIPLIAPAGENWFLAWSTRSGDPSVSVAVATDGYESSAEGMIPGRLVAIVPVGDAIHVLSHLAPTGELHVATFLGMHLPVPIPIPIERTILDLRLTTRLHEPDPIPLLMRADRRTITAPWAPCIEVRETDALVAWTAVNHQVGSIVLDGLGVVDDARFVRGPSGSCTAILNVAGRD